MKHNEKLEMAIEKKRIELIRIGMTKGLTNSVTVKCSQELDELLNIRRGLYINQKRIHKLSASI
ncbi:aspartyl-phosphate phosphatase Spo0E family protein [Halalkalibacter alkaliphilus]|uniref:Aspartyl-phosphate phosphatase Spo0E family protein n=1 Tax=Halalkalibacter alkaliphilus TaxID=2917993 RepID=A0A9X2CVN0_9BACI|nr:aspartyl-phosphate phosphatase Spo0E family protein [Halalkalibacter alkaliphilus]MCL7749201.1 aspartyl-phosphate phosphatase Spo0E family protein [Halalkalibacter alkaliphilus]